MRKISLLIAVFTVTGALFAATPTLPDFFNQPVGPSFAWTETTFNFGQIKIAVPVTHEFTFTNNGKEPLIISSVQASCGCTVASYTKDPILPGGKGFVKATYNAAKAGTFTKTITVNSNVDGGVVLLTIKGEVVEKEGAM